MIVLKASILPSPEWLVIILVFLLLFGAKKLPELMKGLGTGIKEFKKASKDVTDEVNKSIEYDKKD